MSWLKHYSQILSSPPLIIILLEELWFTLYRVAAVSKSFFHFFYTGFFIIKGYSSFVIYRISINL